MEFISRSAEDTEKFAESLAARLLACEKYREEDGVFRCTVALYGGMGMGKTVFVRGFARGAGYGGEVTSPTFAIVHEYLGGSVPVYHFDMYRVTGEMSLYSTGYYDYTDSGGFIVTEWSENIDTFIEEDAVKIEISPAEDENSRIIHVKDCFLYEDTGC